MKKRLLFILLAMVCAVVARSEDQVILPWGVDQPWQMKYVYGEDLVSEDENGTPWYAPNYDDSAWDNLTGPIERNTTNWFSQSFFGWEREGSVLYLRRTFNLDEIPTGKIVVKAIVDGNLNIYINGHLLKRIALGNDMFYIVPQSVLVEGENLMAFDLNDAGGGDARCDYGMFVTDDNNFYVTTSGEKYYVDELGIIYSYEPYDEERGEEYAAERYAVIGLTEDGASDLVFKEEIEGVPVKYIRDTAFLYNGNIRSVTFPNFYYIGAFSFQGCGNLASVHLSKGVQFVGFDAFTDCGNLTSITVDEENPWIDSRDNCNGVIETATNKLISGCKNTVIPYGVTSINYEAFLGNGLTSITIPASVTSFDGAFHNNGGMKSMTVEWTEPLEIQEGALEGISVDQTTLYVPEGTKEAYEAAAVWKDFKQIIEKKTTYVDECGVVYSLVPRNGGNAEHYEVTGVTENYTSDVVVQEKVFDVSVTSIGASAFLNCSSLTSVTIPNNVTNIENRAFAGCIGLTSLYVKWAEPLTVSENIFENVPLSQATLYVPAGSQTAYQNADVWKDFNIQEKEGNYVDEQGVIYVYVAEDGEHIEHYEASGLAEEYATEIVIKDKIYGVPVSRIADRAFHGCENLTTVKISESVTEIGEEAFVWSGLTSIIIPYNVTSIRGGAFWGCSSLKSVSISSSEIYLGSDLFSFCDLTSLNIASSVRSIRMEESLGGTGWSLSSITVDAENPYYDSRDNCNAIIETSSNKLILGCQNTVIPNGVTSIGHGSFRGCRGIATIDIPNSVTTIDALAFDCSSLTSITIPNSVISIGDNAFTDWESNLNSVIVEWREPLEIPGNTFDGVYDQATLYVPYGTKAAYESADVWKDFGNIEEYSSLFVEGTEGPVTLSQGASTHVSVKFGCDKPLTAFQFSIQLPDGFSLSEQALNSDMSNGHKLTVQNKGNGLYNILCSNMKDKAFKELSGELMSFTLSCTEEVEPDTYKAVISGIRFVDESGEYVIMADHTFGITVSDPLINFADDVVKAICVANWDTSGDGELSMAEAAAVTDLGQVFYENYEITSFDELQYFTGLTSLGDGAFNGCINLHSIVIPDNVTSIGPGAFAGSVGLQSVNIPNGVTSIGTDAFAYCISFTSLTISSSVMNIDECAFSNCGALTSVTVEWQEPLAVPENIFEKINYNTATLYVPEGCKAAYKAADVWKEFFMDGDDRDEYNSRRLLRELIANMEAIGGYELDDAKAIAYSTETNKEDVEGCIAQLQQQIKDRCANTEESELPLDVTGLITNPSFTTDTAIFWQGDTPQFESHNNAEFFQTTFDINQELTGLPNGLYLLKVKGFHRPGNFWDVYSDYQQGTNNASAQLYANGESVVLNNITAFAQDEQIDGWCGVEMNYDGKTQYLPNSMTDAYMWFYNGYYENELPVVVTDGTLRLGIRLDESVDGGWVIFDDFRLEYQGEVTMGDVNNNDRTDIQDLQLMIKYMLDKPVNQTFIKEAADHNGDGVINVMDIVEEIDMIMNSFDSNATENNTFDEFGSGLSLSTDNNGAVNVSIADGSKYVASQFVIALNDGQRLTGVTTDRGHAACFRPLSDNRYFVVCYSMDNQEFADNDHAFTLRVTGRGSVAVENVAFVNSNDQMVAFQNVSSGYTTGIAETEGLMAPTDIYSIGGVMLKKNATSTEELPSGLYIVNGKKHSKK